MFDGSSTNPNIPTPGEEPFFTPGGPKTLGEVEEYARCQMTPNVVRRSRFIAYLVCLVLVTVLVIPGASGSILDWMLYVVMVFVLYTTVKAGVDFFRHRNEE